MHRPRTPHTISARGARNLLFGDVAAHPAPFSLVAPFRVSRNPAFVLAACFAAGILCRTWWQPPSHVLTTCALLFLVATLACWKAPRVAWPSVGLFFVALGWCASLLQPSRSDTSLLQYADGLQRQVEAQVETSRLIAASQSSTEDDFSSDAPVVDRELLQVRALRVEDVTPDTSRLRDITGGLVVTLHSRDQSISLPYLPCGTHIQFTARMHPPSRYRDPGVWNYADQLDRDGIAVVSQVDVRSLRVLPALHTPLQCRVLWVQHWFAERIASIARVRLMRSLPAALRFTLADASVLRAMLLGDRSELDQSLRVAFERTGTFHLVVVAGVHISILTGALFLLLQRLRVPVWIALAITCFCATAFAVVTGFGEPVQRALLMSAVYLAAIGLSRDRQPLNALGVATLVMLLLDPHALLEASLQMTVLSVIAIGGIAAPVVNRTIGPCAAALRNIEDVSFDTHFAPHLAQLRVTARMFGRLLIPPSKKLAVAKAQCIPAWLLHAVSLVLEALLLTLIAETVMALPMAVYFHRLTPFAAPANLLALPLIGALLASAMVTFLLSAIHPLLSVVAAVPTAALLHLINWIILSFSGMHDSDVRIPAPSGVCIAMALLLWCVAVVCVREQRRRLGYVGIVAALVAFGLVLLPPAPHVAHDALSFTAIDVGQGDSLLMTSGDGHSMVIDAGGPIGAQEQHPDARFDVGENVVSPLLWNMQLRRIDVLAITHAHSDHLGGAMAVLRNFQPRELWLSVAPPSTMLQSLLQEATQRHIRVRYLHTGDRLNVGDVAVSVLSPRGDYAIGAEPANDDSLVMRLDYGQASVLAEGDAERTSEQTMQQAGLQSVTLLKVGHHGSNTSTTDEFVNAVHPRYAVISCGRGNTFGHPRMPILQRLQALGVQTSRTDTMGAVQYVLRAEGEVETHVLPSE